MPKIITLDNLTEFKSKCDATYGGTQLYMHTLRLDADEETGDFNLDIVSIRSTPYENLSIITNDKNYEVLSYGYIQPEDMGKQVIAFEDTGMDSFLIYYLNGGQIDNIEVSGLISDTVSPL